MRAGGQAAATPTGVGSRPAPGPSLVELASGVHAAIRSFRLIRREPCAFAHTLLTPRRGHARLPGWLRAPHTRKSGMSMRSAATCSMSTCISSTRLRARRPSKACGSPGAPCAGPIARSRRPTTTCPRGISPARSRTTIARQQLDALARNVEEFGIPYYGLGHRRQGIVHVIGPELGITQPGMTIVCGDSHTSTHGAFGALAFGIGTSEVEHVLATQTLPQKRARTLRVHVHGRARRGRRREGPDPRPDRRRRRPRAPPVTSSSTPARRSGRSRWRAG